jgi:hypothetical protein
MLLRGVIVILIFFGVSFLPFDPTEYPQAPYQTNDKEQYERVATKNASPKLIGATS